MCKSLAYNRLIKAEITLIPLNPRVEDTLRPGTLLRRGMSTRCSSADANLQICMIRKV